MSVFSHSRFDCSLLYAVLHIVFPLRFISIGSLVIGIGINGDVISITLRPTRYYCHKIDMLLFVAVVNALTVCLSFS